jgi:hypothetical protein
MERKKGETNKNKNDEKKELKPLDERASEVIRRLARERLPAKG